MTIEGPYPNPMENAIQYALTKSLMLDKNDLNKLCTTLSFQASRYCEDFYSVGFHMASIQENLRKGHKEKAISIFNEMQHSIEKKYEKLHEFEEQCWDLYEAIPDSKDIRCLDKVYDYYVERLDNIETMLKKFYEKNGFGSESSDDSSDEFPDQPSGGGKIIFINIEIKKEENSGRWI
jgi:hypothetical protein